MAAGLDAGKGATLRARVLGYNWERQGQRSIMECGLFVLDDVSFSDAPTTLQVGGVSKPSDSDFRSWSGT